MKIALIGYGKMGKEIEKISLSRGHTIILKIDAHNLEDLNRSNLAQCDVAIEFTNPESAPENIKICLEAGCPVVCGTTGWLKRLEEMKNMCIRNDGAFLYASNFSIGVNIFFEVNKNLARMMAKNPEYDISIEEIHHTQKKDSPSGTAITLAEQVLKESKVKDQWVNKHPEIISDLGILSLRIDPAPGTHTVNYTSSIDDIKITHTAHNRKGFAQGAVLAAEFIIGKKGIFEMKDVLGL